MTAYEMRISDWSSYVCSSDLDLAVGIRLQGQVLLLGTQLTIKRADVHIACEPCGEMIVRGKNFARARQKAEDVGGGFLQCAQRACCKKNGRGSCRERVSPNVEICVIADSFIKIHNHQY